MSIVGRALLVTWLALPLHSGCGPGNPGDGDRGGDPDAPARGSAPALSVAEALRSGSLEGYERADSPRTFSFPEDHGPHRGFRTEWWYLTGHLHAESDREFGFQLTFFRNALNPVPPTSRSLWATNQVYMAHLALTDPSGGEFHAFERFARGAAGLAGARADPLRVWLENWSLEGAGAWRDEEPDPESRAGENEETEASAEGETEGHEDGEAEGGDADSAFPLRIRAREGVVALDLVLEEGKGVVLQGDRGLSRKGPEPGNASYYYSYPRMPASGTVTVGGDRFRVRGTGWLDREWSTSALSGEQVGWDWFSLQLDDGRELMYYRLRNRDGSADPRSAGVVVGDGGEVDRIGPEDVELEATDSWESPVDGTRYPSGWRIALPDRGMELRIDPLLQDQELDVTFRYWEGAVEVSGTSGGAPVTGRGYVELTGYADPPPVSLEGG